MTDISIKLRKYFITRGGVKIVASYERKTKNIYILLSNTGTLFTKTIGLYTKAPYNHTSLALNEDLMEIYSFGRKNPINPFVAGFVRENETGIYDYYKDTTCEIYKLEIDSNIYEKIKMNIILFERYKESYNFNLIGLFGIIANRPIKRKKAYFCSQFVYSVLERNGVKLFDKPAELVTPKDFQYCKELKLIYEGRFLDYTQKLEVKGKPLMAIVVD